MSGPAVAPRTPTIDTANAVSRTFKRWAPPTLVVLVALWLFKDHSRHTADDTQRSMSEMFPGLGLDFNNLSFASSFESLGDPARWRELIAQSLPSMPQVSLLVGGGNTDPEVRPGLRMAHLNYTAKHPVVIIPGFVSAGLELWEGKTCAKKYFRQRMWGTLTMIQTFLLDAACWFEHMALDPVTGMDPQGIKIRSALGLEAVDYFIQGYFVWGKMIEALSDVGYDPNTLVSMAYDWRLAIPLLEARDGYFSRLKGAVEVLLHMTGHKAVIVAHSYGENVLRAFLHWVEKLEPGWTEKHVHGLVNIAGSVLGAPKVLSSLLSGELKDTAQLGALAGYMTDTFLSRQSRARLFRTWGSLMAMLPSGGPAVWGSPERGAADDDEHVKAGNRTFGSMVTVWPHNWADILSVASPAVPLPHPAPGQTAEDSTHAADAAPPTAADEAAAPRGQAAQRGTEESCPSGATAGTEGRAAEQGTDSCANRDPEPSSPSVPEREGVLRSMSGRFHAWFHGGGEKPHTPFDLPLDLLTPLDVEDALQLMMKAVGPTIAAHYAEWGGRALDVSRMARKAEYSTWSETLQRFMGVGPTGQAANEGRPEANNDNSAIRSEPSDAPTAVFPSATDVPLPNAPSLSIFCLYGHGKPTERAFHYTLPNVTSPKTHPPPPTLPPPTRQPPLTPLGAATPGTTLPHRSHATPGPGKSRGAGGGGAPGCEGGDGGKLTDDGSVRTAVGKPAGRPAGSADDLLGSFDWRFFTDLHQPENRLEYGVQLSDGDGTVPLISLGLMCRKGWKTPRLNPGGIRVVTREFNHTPVSMMQDPRGGPETGDHVDILGNFQVLMDVIKVVCGKGDEVTDFISSSIDEIAARVDFD
ncbi:MAG: hypothetical protein WDW36_002297 [Sanguina aurantia]